MTIEPDTKDWTWVVDRPCTECGFDPSGVSRDALPDLLRDTVAGFVTALDDEDRAVRPHPTVWSPLEYSCHVRDVHRVFDGRLARMLDEDDPAFDSWDQDAEAVEQDYGSQDPASVARELAEAADAVAARYAAVPEAAWGRTGRRGDGAVFTVEALGRYHLHDAVHHLYDVGS